MNQQGQGEAESYDFFTKVWDENILEEVVVDPQHGRKEKSDSKQDKTENKGSNPFLFFTSTGG